MTCSGTVEAKRPQHSRLKIGGNWPQAFVCSPSSSQASARGPIVRCREFAHVILSVFVQSSVAEISRSPSSRSHRRCSLPSTERAHERGTPSDRAPTHTTICLRPSSGLRMNLRVRRVTGVSASAMIATGDDGWVVMPGIFCCRRRGRQLLLVGALFFAAALVSRCEPNGGALAESAEGAGAGSNWLCALTKSGGYGA